MIRARIVAVWLLGLLWGLPSHGAPATAPPSPMLAVVVAADWAEPLGTDALARAYLRKKQRWDDGRRLLPVNLPAGHPLRQSFSRAVLRQTTQALEDYWNEQYFHGVLPPHVVQSTAAMARFVAQTEGAVGYLPYCEVDASLRVLWVITVQGQLQSPERAQRICP
ncbi:hypothetical protein [Sinimarinibacterium sp. NLF-5-8]|uniref:hypothetical protein n=1 Tax=Sinimarinibacterium sp. NLF-5-8 TaxID=2698684 RepID=UPI00137BCACB|nr:hypothetical protein [Sinimarinibacterium sp. NLF-5-8]QHS09787.1 hypothetical protein GT972_06210 [Sinimarinibacterium sp. NLF-5-8]